MYNNRSNFGTMNVREKFMKRGVAALTDLELLQTIVVSGGKGNDYKDIAKNINALINKIGIDNVSVDDLKSIKGVGDAKAAVIFAALEFWRRKFTNQEMTVIDKPEIAAKQFEDIRNRKQECVMLLTLDGARRLINKYLVSVGTLTASYAHPREIFYPAIEDRAASIIIGHNHPSGKLAVSEEDKEVTKRIHAVGDLMGIPLDDHIIVSSEGFVSAE
jgi:DNA repair protein RadC